MKLKVEVIGHREYEITQTPNSLAIDGKEMTYRLISNLSGEYLAFIGTKIYPVQLLEQKGNEIIISINEQRLTLKVKDHIDQILEELGMDQEVEEVVNEILAPMPGAIIDVLVKEGEEVDEGRTLLILEAMKMENIIKSPGKATISKLHVGKGDNVEKRQVLISF